MINPLNPEHVKGVVSLLLDIAERATPITLLVLLAWIVYQQRDIRHVQAVNAQLWQQLVDAQKAQVDMAWRCQSLPHTPPPAAEPR